MVAASILVLAVVAGVALQRATPPPPPTAPAPGLTGDLVFAAGGTAGRSQLWIWDLRTGALRRGPTVRAPLTLVNAYAAEPQGGWIGVVSEGEEGQTAGLLRNFAVNDVPAPVLEGTLVSWAPGGDRVVAATKEGDGCSPLRVETLTFAVGAARLRMDRPECAALSAVGLDGLYPHVGLRDDIEAWIARVAGGVAEPWARSVRLVAVAPNGGALVTRSCVGIAAASGACYGLAYADPAIPGFHGIVPYRDEDVGSLVFERFLGWSIDGRTGFVLGTFGEVRGVYAVEPIREGPRPPRLILPSLAAEVHLTESFGVQGGDLFVARDGALLAIRPDGEQVPLALPAGIPAPDGPIVWVAAAGGA